MKLIARDCADGDLRRCLDALYLAQARATGRRPADAPSIREIRDLLRLFARIESEDVRHAVLHLLRTIAEPAF